eukprot:GHVR01096005.1.p1 GENE.GHVR01096005.1~~GHVR01096005.1.p1  ORF type:complete len:320 (+),score=60.08 GHVR01096005.1:28-987(+)
MPCPVCPYIKCTCTMIGAVVLGYVVIRLLWCVINRLVTPKRKISEMGKWAVITGCTDGIGKALAVEMARANMSLLLISRSKDRLEETKKLLSAITDGEVRILPIDFTSCSNEIYPKIECAIKDIEVGILINNVGVSYPHAMYFNEITSEFIDQLIEVNVRAVLRMSHIVYNKMILRKNGAILCVGSGSSVVPSDPLYAAYAGTKAVCEAFCRSLQEECRNKNIVVQCHTPLFVTTKMSKLKTPTHLVPTPAKYAKASVASLERSDRFEVVHSPYFIHTLVIYVIQLLPSWLFNQVRLKSTKSIRARALKKNAEKEEKQQ